MCVIQPAQPALQPALCCSWCFFGFLTVYAVIVISYIYNNKERAGERVERVIIHFHIKFIRK